ncbi:hypothetical protein GYA13_03230 [Candidatus Kuenenbacteria bacterium]|nr:hypothetical protein [Candidatus Kuenenbacteria bacterium]
MKFSPQDPRFKVYLIMGITMVIIFTVWIITLAHTLKKNSPSINPLQRSETLEPIEQKLNNFFQDIENLKDMVKQSSTSTSATLQNAASFQPAELDEIIERLNIATSTPTSTPTTTKLQK